MNEERNKLWLRLKELLRCVRNDRWTFNISENVFCALHRLPELHNCDFDHKEDGRREAREKMVKPVRHLGTSFKRLDTDTWNYYLQMQLFMQKASY